jgi:hypothetical protein
MDSGLHIHHPKHSDVARSQKTAGKTHVFGFSGGTPMDERGMVRISHIWPYGAKPTDSCLAGRAVPRVVAPACRVRGLSLSPFSLSPPLPFSLSPLPSFSAAHGTPQRSAMLQPVEAAEAPPGKRGACRAEVNCQRTKMRVPTLWPLLTPASGREAFAGRPLASRRNPPRVCFLRRPTQLSMYNRNYP